MLLRMRCTHHALPRFSFAFCLLMIPLALSRKQSHLTTSKVADDESDEFAPGFGISALETAGEGLDQADGYVRGFGYGEIFCVEEENRVRRGSGSGGWVGGGVERVRGKGLGD